MGRHVHFHLGIRASYITLALLSRLVDLGAQLRRIVITIMYGATMETVTLLKVSAVQFCGRSCGALQQSGTYSKCQSNINDINEKSTLHKCIVMKKSIFQLCQLTIITSSTRNKFKVHMTSMPFYFIIIKSITH